MTEPDKILAEYWGFDSFRPLQREIIESVLQGHDTLGLLPTGGGKSITFQVSALILPGLTVIVTPLISLMKDQVDNLLARHIPAVYLHSGMTPSEQRLVLDKCRLGKARMLYLSPEKLSNDAFIDVLRWINVSLIVVDEAHCISQWGYDFRPSYLNITKLRKIFPEVPVLALTASAPPEVRNDIAKNLSLRSPRLFVQSFSRPNISYVVRHSEDKEGMLLKALKSTQGTAIVYVRSRKRTKELADKLTAAGISALAYHAGLDIEDKNHRQKQWKDSQVRVMVATTAFGMGIDKHDVRLVVHYDIPSSLEEYYQEAGRAGRDGKPSIALTIASRYDRGVLSRRIADAFPSRDYIRKIYQLACVFLDIPMGDGFDRVCNFDIDLFCSRFKLNPAMVRSALMLISRSGHFDYVEDGLSRSRIMIKVAKRELYDLKLDPLTDSVLQLILRTYTGIFAEYTPVNEDLIASRLGINAEQVYRAMLTLSRERIITYIPRSNLPYIYFTSSRKENQEIIIPLEVYETRKQAMEKRINAVKDFVYSDDGCRVAKMLAYFGEENSGTCGRCDVCRDRDERLNSVSSLVSSIIYLASQPGGHTVSYISAQLGVRTEKIVSLVRPLLDDGTLVLHGTTITCPDNR